MKTLRTSNIRVIEALRWFLPILFVLVATSARADLYTGSLTYIPPLNSADSLMVGGPAGGWPSQTITMSWTVSNGDLTYAEYPWKYTYQLTRNNAQFGFGHVIIEVNPLLTQSNFTGITNATLNSLAVQNPGGGNPNMPSSVYGLKFDPPTSGLTNWTFTFYTNASPTWGDFYLRGGTSYAYNYTLTGSTATGFLPIDSDSLLPPSLGTPANGYFTEILRPSGSFESQEIDPVTEPAMLGLVGIALIALRRRRE